MKTKRGKELPLPIPHEAGGIGEKWPRCINAALGEGGRERKSRSKERTNRERKPRDEKTG